MRRIKLLGFNAVRLPFSMGVGAGLFLTNPHFN